MCVGVCVCVCARAWARACMCTPYVLNPFGPCVNVHQTIGLVLQVIGQSRLPSLKDKGTIPYTEATILEVQRLACVGK